MLLLGTLSCGPQGDHKRDRIAQELADSLVLLGRTADFNGFGVAIVGPDGVLYRNAFGQADVAKGIAYTANTVQPIASISKTFVGLAVMKAQELGQLKLDDPVDRYLPFPVVNPHHPGERLEWAST